LTNPLRSLRGLTSVLVISAFIAGGVVVWLWLQSNFDWREYQNRAYVTGIGVHGALKDNAIPPRGVLFKVLSKQDQALATAGNFQQITGAPRAARETNIPISADTANPQADAPLALVILSPDLVYRLAELSIEEGQTAAIKTGNVFRLLASYCSDPLVLARFGDGPWVQIDGASVWGCDAAPADRRLLATLLSAIVIAILMTISLNLSSDFTLFATQLRNRRQVGGPASYDIQGPQELQDIVASVNAYLETERAQLEGRAAVLSGVSHDLGTPATRLRLRAALIKDQVLREKLEADIDSMTDMIESVLTYTRAEMNVEDPRKISLTALVGAVVSNYEDMGHAVSLQPTKDVIVKGASSVFMSRQGQTVMAGEREVTIMGRPISLERALTNLIDNALKYGRRATVSLETDAETATIVVEDEGTDNLAIDIEALMAPFQRGDNTKTIKGYGLGLTIVATIAGLHGGSLTFEDTTKGVAARLQIRRG
jgi:two-component system osmolarity sensor histidine kinase EnvZ